MDEWMDPYVYMGHGHGTVPAVSFFKHPACIRLTEMHVYHEQQLAMDGEIKVQTAKLRFRWRNVSRHSTPDLGS